MRRYLFALTLVAMPCSAHASGATAADAVLTSATAPLPGAADPFRGGLPGGAAGRDALDLRARVQTLEATMATLAATVRALKVTNGPDWFTRVLVAT